MCCRAGAHAFSDSRQPTEGQDRQCCEADRLDRVDTEPHVRTIASDQRSPEDKPGGYAAPDRNRSRMPCLLEVALSELVGKLADDAAAKLVRHPQRLQMDLI